MQRMEGCRNIIGSTVCWVLEILVDTIGEIFVGTVFCRINGRAYFADWEDQLVYTENSHSWTTMKLSENTYLQVVTVCSEPVVAVVQA